MESESLRVINLLSLPRFLVLPRFSDSLSSLILIGIINDITRSENVILRRLNLSISTNIRLIIIKGLLLIRICQSLSNSIVCSRLEGVIGDPFLAIRNNIFLKLRTRR